MNPEERRKQELETSILETSGRAQALEPGTSLGPYRIAEQIGAGGMGVVYRAIDTRLNRMVAIKLIAPDSEGGGRNRLFAEARAASTLNHPNIVTIYEYESA